MCVCEDDEYFKPFSCSIINRATFPNRGILQNHAKNEVERVLERVYSYRGTISRVPDICNIHKVL